MRPNRTGAWRGGRAPRPRPPRASAEQIIGPLTRIGRLTGHQGEADRLARAQAAELRRMTGASLVRAGMHETLLRFIDQFAALDRAIARQFRFG